MKKEIVTRMVLITPEIAKRVLNLNKSNRPLNKKTVEYYAKQMANGQWTLSGQTISMSDRNTLLDGQHRLSAVILSAVPIYFNVAYNVPYESFVNYDSLRTRGMADVFAIEDVKNYVGVAAIISKYTSFKNGYFSHLGFSESLKSGGICKNKKLSNIESVSFYNQFPDLFNELANASQRFSKKINLFPKSTIGALMLYLILDLKHDKDKVFSFFTQLYFNENVENYSIYLLREKLISGSIGRYRMIGKLKLIYLIKCWNAYVTGKQIKNYSFNESDVMPSFI